MRLLLLIGVVVWQATNTNAIVPITTANVSANIAIVPENDANVPINSPNVPVNSPNVPVQSTNIPTNSANVPVNRAKVPVNRLNELVNRFSVPINRLNVPVNTAIRSVNTFSNNIVKAIVDDAPTNLICSPISADMVLSMAAFGANGSTKKALQSALGLTDFDDVTKNDYLSLVDDLNNSKGFDLRIANKIFLAEGLEPKADFRDVTEKVFRSPAQNVNFADPFVASKIINDWAEAQTNNHIKDLIKADDLTKDTALVLINAIYFKATWEIQFIPHATKSLPFHVNGKNVTNVEIMRNVAEFKHGELPDVKAKYVEMPYKADSSNDAASMFIILPNEIDGIAELVKNLDKVRVEQLQQGTSGNVFLSLPKFKIESTIDLQKALDKLGLAEIFSDDADFSGIVSSPQLKVNKIVQKAFIEVNEKGTEASAATELQTTTKMGGRRRFIFNVNHPFVAVIATKSGIPIFTSVVTEPIF